MKTVCKNSFLYPSLCLKLYLMSEVHPSLSANTPPVIHRIESDPVAATLSGNALPVPQSHKSSREAHKSLQEDRLLAVIICLAPPPESLPSTTPPTTSSAPTSAPALVPIGCVALTKSGPAFRHHRTSSISIDIIAPYQGKGYGREAINWVLDWGFRIAGLHRVGIECFSYNSVAKGLYEGIGFVFEGRRRGLLWFEGGWHDFLMWGMLEEEWRGLREKEKEKEKEGGK